MKKIIIMGATSGIGLEVAKRFARKGYRVGVAGRRAETLTTLKKTFPDNIEWEKIDITKADASYKLSILIEKLGGMDTYFHVAGVYYENPELDINNEMAILETNAVGFARMIATAYKYFRDTHTQGHIAAVTSVAGTRGMGPLASYSATKKFGQTYLEALEQLSHMQKANIKFTDIRPGWIRTPLMNPDAEYPMTMKLSYAAARIIKSLKHIKTTNYVDWRWEIIVRLIQIIPRCMWVHIPLPVSWPATSRQVIKNVAAEETQKNV